MVRLALSEASPGETTLLLVHAPYPARLKFQAPPSSLLSAIAPFARAVDGGLVGEETKLGLLDPGGTSPAFYEHLRAVLQGGSVRAVCVSTSTAAIEETAKVVRVVREELGDEVLVVVGGPHEDDVEEKVATRMEGVDLSIAGEAEYVLDFVLREYLAKGGGLRFVEELLERLPSAELSGGAGEVTASSGRKAHFDFGRLGPEEFSLPRPWVNRSIPFEVFDAKTTVPLMVSRGCPYGKCTFCAEGISSRSRLVATEFSWVTELIERNPGAAIYFQDSIFPGTPAVQQELLPLLRESGVEWGCQVYLRTLSRGFLEKLVDDGCSYLYTGVESGSAEVLRAVGKVNLGADVIEERIAWMGEVGLRVGVSLMFGTMDLQGRVVESEATLQQTRELAECLAGLADIQGFYPNVQTVLPGTGLAKAVARTAPTDLDFYRVPTTAAFRGMEDGAVGYNFHTLGLLSERESAWLCRMIAEEALRCATICDAVRRNARPLPTRLSRAAWRKPIPS